MRSNSLNTSRIPMFKGDAEIQKPRTTPVSAFHVNGLKEDVNTIACKLGFPDIVNKLNEATKNGMQIKDLSPAQAEDHQQIKKFYLTISSYTDASFLKQCKKLHLRNTKELLIWKKLIESYFVESAHKTVVPNTPVDIINKMISWGKAVDDNKGFGMHMFYLKEEPAGFIGLTAMEENKAEINFVVFDKFRGNNIAEKASRAFIQDWKEFYDPDEKYTLYGEAFGDNLPSINTIKNLGGEFTVKTNWIKDETKTVDQYQLSPSLKPKPKVTNHSEQLQL